jgi:hypothetical protein
MQYLGISYHYLQHTNLIDTLPTIGVFSEHKAIGILAKIKKYIIIYIIISLLLDILDTYTWIVFFMY